MDVQLRQPCEVCGGRDHFSAHWKQEIGGKKFPMVSCQHDTGDSASFATDAKGVAE